MKPLNLLIVTRRFWPHSGLTELALSELAQNFVRAGHRVTVATFKWERNWPVSVTLNNVNIVRFSRPVTGPWTSFRYSRALSRHFARHDYDAVVVSGMGQEAMAATTGLDETTPVFVYLDDSFVGVSGAIHRKHIEVCLAADGVITTSSAVKQLVKNIEFMPATKLVHPGLPIFDDRTSNRVAVRAALSKAHPVVRLDENQKLVVSATRMRTQDGLLSLVEAWPRVLKTFPNAKLWLIGEGPNTNRVWQRVIELDLAYSVLFPGYFDHLNEIFVAADLYVHTATADHSADGLVRAQSVGLASLAVRNRVTSQLIEDGVNGWLVADGAPNTLSRSLICALAQPEQRHSIGHSAKNMLSDCYSPAVQVNRYVDLITSCTSPLVESVK